MKTAAIILAPIAFSSMAASASPPPAARAVTVARIGETVRIQGFRVTPLRVVEDSRCPQNARCVWAGRVRLSVRINGTTRELTLGQPALLAGGSLQLAAVLPERKRRERAIAPRDYRFGFRFDRTLGIEPIKHHGSATLPH